MSAIRVKYVSKKISKVRWRQCSNSEFITGSWDDEANTICVWRYPTSERNSKTSEYDLLDPELLTEVAFPGDVTDLKVTNDDLVFASSTRGSLEVYRFADDTLHHQHTWDKDHIFAHEGAEGTALALNGSYIASVGMDGRLCLYDCNKLQKFKQFESPELCAFTAVSYPRRWEIITGNVHGYLSIWDLRSTSDSPSRTMMISGDDVGVTSMNVHPTQPHILATGHEDGRLCIWDLRQERHQTTSLAGHSAAILDILFHPVNPDVLYTCSLDGAVLQWNASALRSGVGDHDHMGYGNPWLNCDASKHRLDITSLFGQNKICVNSLDLKNSTLLWGTDSEALFILRDIIV